MGTSNVHAGWVIDRDYLNASGDPYCRVGYGQTASDADATGWRTVTVTRGLTVGQVDDPVRFRVLDDDGIVYFGGAIARAWLDGDEELSFAPLTFATADAGATELQYRDGADWRTL
jgi:hypothetical protein